MRLTGRNPKRPHRRARKDFTLNSAATDYLASVTWDRQVVAVVANRLRATPNGNRYFWTVSPGPVYASLLALSALVVVVSLLPDQVHPAVDWLVRGAMLIAFAVYAYTLVRDTRLLRKYAEIHVLNRLIAVVELSSDLLGDLTRYDVRVMLADAIDEAARRFRWTYPLQPSPRRKTKRALKRHSRRCSAVLASYAERALTGDSRTIESLREDFARAFIRVGTGHWAQVADLQVSDESSRRPSDYLPRVPLKEILAVLVPAVGLAAAVAKWAAEA